jgi:hypothetical protein
LGGCAIETKGANIPANAIDDTRERLREWFMGFLRLVAIASDSANFGASERMNGEADGIHCFHSVVKQLIQFQK